MTDATIELDPQVRAHYPWTGRFVTHPDGVRQHVLDVGQGAPLLMVHGNPTWSFYYRTLVAGLSGDYRCVAPDHVGCGLSDKPQDWAYTLEAHVANLVRVIEQLDLRDVTLIVHDWGGPIGFGAAERVPDRIRRIVIFNTGVFDGPLPLSIRACRWPLVGDVVIRRFNGFLKTGLVRAIADKQRMKNGVEKGYLAPYDSYAHRVAHERFVLDIPLEDGHPTRDLFFRIRDGLAQFADRPIAVIWGEQDFCFTTFYRDEWMRRFPNAELHSFPDASHWVVEDAHERILPILRAFFAKNTG